MYSQKQKVSSTLSNLTAKEEHHKEGLPHYKMRLVYWEERMREGIDWMCGKKGTVIQLTKVHSAASADFPPP